jgi:hypothetical protein
MASQCSKCGKRLPWLRSLDYNLCSACDANNLTAPARVTAGSVGNLFLGFGQLVSALGCVAAPVYAIVGLVVASNAPAGAPGSAVWVVAGAMAGFAYSAAMFVVFGRVRGMPPAAFAEPGSAADGEGG